MRNLPNLSAIIADPDILKGLPLDVINVLLEEAAGQKKEADAAAKALKGAVLDRYSEALKAQYAAKGSDTGTVHLVVDGFDLEVNTPKDVEWDQDQLAALAAKIAAGGDDPGEYIKVERKVEEKAFTSWPAFLRNQFAPARTVKPGNPTLAITLAKAEAA